MLKMEWPRSTSKSNRTKIDSNAWQTFVSQHPDVKTYFLKNARYFYRNLANGKNLQEKFSSSNMNHNRIGNNNKDRWICVIKGKGIMFETMPRFENVTLANNSILLNHHHHLLLFMQQQYTNPLKSEWLFSGSVHNFNKPNWVGLHHIIWAYADPMLNSKHNIE